MAFLLVLIVGEALAAGLAANSTLRTLRLVDLQGAALLPALRGLRASSTLRVRGALSGEYWQTARHTLRT